MTYQTEVRRRRLPATPSMIPNIITLMGLGCGLMAIREAIAGHFVLVLIFVVAQSVLDFSDGRMARLLNSTSPMGAQLDSLCDAIGFGVAPAIVTYSLISSQDHQRFAALAWFAAVVYVSCIVLRLARFNVAHDDEDIPEYEHGYFTGVPAPAASWLALAPLVARMAFGHGWWSSPLFCAIWLIAVGCLAFSRIRTFSFKTVHLTSEQVPWLLLAGVILIAGAFTVPLITVLVLDVAYLCLIPAAVVTHRRLRQGRPKRPARRRSTGRRLRGVRRRLERRSDLPAPYEWGA